MPMRDGVAVVVDVYRPDAAGKFPVLFAFGVHSKELQGHELPNEFPPQPSWSSLWLGHAEAGDTEFFVLRGYVHVVGSPRGFLKSGDGGSREWDSYDVIEWIAKQPWCDGNIGMIGIGAFASEQFHLARQQPPLFKAIFPYDPRGAYGKFGGFREEYPGGVLHTFRYLMDHFSSYTRRATRRAHCRRTKKKNGVKQSPTPTSACIRIYTTCWSSAANTCRATSMC